MGKYSIKGSDAFDARLDKEFSRIANALVESRYAPAFRALVLIGGYGRGEGTPLVVDGMQVPFNDYDLVVISKPMGHREKVAVQADLRRLEAQLSGELKLPVDLCLYPENVLRQAEFSLLNYEMRYGHRVVWGEQDIVSLMPEYPHGAVPLSEGTRLLLNRGKLLLDIRRALRTGAEFTPDERIRYIKFMFKTLLAFGDCTLLVRREYDLLYAVKKERILRAMQDDMPDPAFMVEGFRRAVAFKEWGDFRPLENEAWRDEFERIRAYYVRFFEWYEGRRLGARVSKVDDYRRALAASGRECGRSKAALLNLSLFRGEVLNNGIAFLGVHPRARLYLALPLLLGDDCPASELRRILAAPACSREAIETRFYQLQKRLS